ncbi:MAG: hypothetical protein D6694_12110 [Gammaproteobacteria bacterium]|nr:MAG: hypothetical protein D6694_12110 [Gammaproteobacteria bacterium]
MRIRRKLSAPFRELEQDIARLKRTDAENQAKYVPGPGRPASGSLTKTQLHLLTEALFFRGFRSFESFIRDVFLLYCLEKKPSGRKHVRSYLAPSSFQQAEELVKGESRFLDWARPDSVLSRAELYLRDGFPIKEVYAPRMETLRDLKRLRNHIAHDSPESRTEYLKVLRKHFGVNPLVEPDPGEFLLMTDRTDPSRYKLIVYLDFILDTARALT